MWDLGGARPRELPKGAEGQIKSLVLSDSKQVGEEFPK